MDKCIDHPDNIAVEVCKECSKLICGLHSSGYCLEHAKIENSAKQGKSIALLFVIFSISLFVFVGSLLVSFLSSINDLSNTDQGGVVTIQSDTITITDTSVLPDAGTLLFVALGVAIPILITIAVVLIRVAQAAKEPSVSIKDVPDEVGDTVFFCQQCGHKLTMSDDTCPSCGKDISDEKGLVS